MIIVLCMTSLIATGALAYPAPNSMGVYMDAEATGLLEVCTALDQYVAVNLYLLIAGPTESQVAAWEAQVEIVSAGLYFGSWEILGNGLNVDTPPNYIVGNGATPIQQNAVGNIVLMSISMTEGDASSPIEIFVRGVPGSTSGYDGPVYSHTPGFLNPCVTSTGGPLVPVFIVNPDGGDCTITEETDSTWGEVKSLYK